MKLWTIFDHITDDAQCEYLEMNSTKQGIAQMADAIDLHATTDEIQFIFDKLKEYAEKPPESSNDFYHRFKSPLRNHGS